MEYNGRLEDKDGNIFNPKTTPKQAGLGNVKDYPINSDINANSDKEYASTSMVAKVRAEKADANHSHEIENKIIYKIFTNAEISEGYDWYDLFEVVDNRGVILCNLMCYAHSSILFSVNTDFNGNNPVLTIHNYALSSNGEYKYLKGIRIVQRDRKSYVQIKLNLGRITDIRCIILNGVQNVVTVDSLKPYTGNSGVVKIAVNTLTHGKMYTQGKIIATVSTYYLQKKAEEKLLQLELEALNG